MTNDQELENITETIDIGPKAPYTLKAKGGDYKSTDNSKKPTDPMKLSRSILHVLVENPNSFCNILSVGPTAQAVVLAAYRLASKEYSGRTTGTTLVLTQSEYVASIAGNKTRGVCTRIFPIKVSELL